MEITEKRFSGNARTQYGALVRLASKELMKDLAPWWSLAVSSAFTAMGLYFYVGSLVRGAQFDGDIGRAYVESGANGFTLLIIVSLVTIFSSSKVAVTLQRKDIVLWRLTGLSERQTIRVVLVEVLIASVVGAFVGACSALVFWPVWKLVLRGADMPYAESLASPPLAAFPIVVASLAFTAVLGSLKAGSVAAHLRPVILLKSVERAKCGSRWFATVVSIAGFSLVTYLLFVVMHTSSDSQAIDITQKTTFIYLGTSFSYAVVLGIAGKHFVRHFLRMWTAVVPERWSRAWFLASRQAGHELEISSSLVVPLAVSLILITGIFGYVGQAEDVAEALGISFAGKGIDVGALIQLLGFPILLTLINAGGLATATRSIKGVIQTC